MRRVLVPLLQAGYGNSPFYDLMQRLEKRFEFVVVTHSETVREDCGAFESHLIPPISPEAGLLGEYRAQKNWARQAQQLLKELQPDAALLSGDFQGLLYHLAQSLPSVVVQVTSDFVSPKDRAVGMIGTGWKRHFATRTMAGLGRLTGLSLVGQVMGKAHLPHGLKIGKTLGAAMAGVQHSAIKGAFADRFCLNGEFYAQTYAEAGIDPAKMVVTGSPTDDWLADFIRDFSPVHDLRHQFEIPPTTHVISFFLQPFNQNLLGKTADYPREVAEITQQLAALDGVLVMVKQHPRHRPDEFAHLEKSGKVRLLADQHYHGDDFNNRLIKSSDLVITRTSTVGLNAMALGVPLLTYERYHQPIETDFRYILGSLHLLADQDIPRHAHALLHDEAQRRAVLERQTHHKHRYMQLDGRSCERIGDVLAVFGS